MKYYIIKFVGPFAFIKPWTAVRDGETFSQQFLTPSMLEGMEKKLFPEMLHKKGLQNAIVGHRLNYTAVSRQQEQTWSKAWIEKSGEPIITQKIIKRKGVEELKEVKIPTITRRPATGIISRGILLEPNLYLAFSSIDFARRAFVQHICLARNEDILFPEEIIETTEAEWNSPAFPGFELLFGNGEVTNFKTGYNRFADADPMYGRLTSYGDPIRKMSEY
jgi:hypothetical protein